MQHGMLHWILEHEKDIARKTSKICSLVSDIVLIVGFPFIDNYTIVT